MWLHNNLEKILQKLPDASGIYLFYSAEKELVYVGKATSLKSRVRSYFRGQRSPRPIEEMIHEVADIDWKETDSVLEAIILEAEYIKKFQPKYNVEGKDDKSWNYITISKDAYPKVETMRQREYQLPINKEQLTKQFARVFGPFPGLNTKAAMKLLRRMFRFSTCEPGSRPCLYRQMGWCLGVCTGEITAQEYRRQVIRPLTTFLSGRKKQVIKMFEAEMKRAGKDERFEDAARLRDQLKALQRIQDIALLNKSFIDNEQLTNNTEQTIRVEGYDISNLGATEKVGSMVVLGTDGPIKSEYRKFIVKSVTGQSDVDSLREVLGRRLNHPEWPFPTVFLIDGGRPQVNTAKAVLQERGVVVPIVGIAKGPERKRNDLIIANFGENTVETKGLWPKAKLVSWVKAHEKLLIAARDEAHRFAITFHRERRGKRGLR